jgi:hypothetical protein
MLSVSDIIAFSNYMWNWQCGYCFGFQRAGGVIIRVRTCAAPMYMFLLPFRIAHNIAFAGRPREG